MYQREVCHVASLGYAKRVWQGWCWDNPDSESGSGRWNTKPCRGCETLDDWVRVFRLRYQKYQEYWKKSVSQVLATLCWYVRV